MAPENISLQTRRCGAMTVGLIWVLVMACAATATTSAVEPWDNAGVRVALRVYDECTKADGFTPCLKKKALVFVNRLSRMDKLALTEGVVLVRSEDAATSAPVVSEEQLDNTLPRAADARDATLNSMLIDNITSFVGSRTLQVRVPASELIEEGRMKKMRNKMGGMMMGIAGKMAAMIPAAIAGLFLLAGKALITAKIAFLIIGIIILKKLIAAKQGGGGGGGGHGGGWKSGGGGGWNSGGGGGGWDRRSLNDINVLPYKAYVPQ